MEHTRPQLDNTEPKESLPRRIGAHVREHLGRYVLAGILGVSASVVANENMDDPLVGGEDGLIENVAISPIGDSKIVSKVVERVRGLDSHDKILEQVKKTASKHGDITVYDGSVAPEAASGDYYIIADSKANANNDETVESARITNFAKELWSDEKSAAGLVTPLSYETRDNYVGTRKRTQEAIASVGFSKTPQEAAELVRALAIEMQQQGVDASQVIDATDEALLEEVMLKLEESGKGSLGIKVEISQTDVEDSVTAFSEEKTNDDGDLVFSRPGDIRVEYIQTADEKKLTDALHKKEVEQQNRENEKENQKTKEATVPQPTETTNQKEERLVACDAELGEVMNMDIEATIEGYENTTTVFSNDEANFLSEVINGAESPNDALVVVNGMLKEKGFDVVIEIPSLKNTS
jgi:hypothetical protein